MKDLIDVFKMDEISVDTRASIIIKLGTAINYQYGHNLTEPLVYELVSLLNPEHPILKDADFLKRAEKETK